jgi:hypothetical protein
MVRTLASRGNPAGLFRRQAGTCSLNPEVQRIYQDTTDQLATASKDAKRVIDDNEAAARDIVQLLLVRTTRQR